MEHPSVKVNFIGKEGNKYLIKFPDLKIPVSVNKNLYVKMLNSDMYEFMNLPKQYSRVNSA
ncbi:hypothetical protein SAMN05421824_2722 [Hyunsoonleella jejuensis]|uniref:Uncharacterized protein n=1 Tax=Hyunsoonleella jejuensis TaxID=419940 RepID=A0A1H9KEH3_9FLAO|nr:hypothetical protein [Hyunsoonleella jejuensis]SEQ97478.1 hypothetical protein SAMN05421824_2722 [Hyunsoonleella jejuensis]